MSATESMGDKRPENKPGLYRHEASGTELKTAAGSKGRIQADAMVRLGYVWVGDAQEPKAATAEPKK